MKYLDLDSFDGCTSFGWMWSSAIDSNPDNTSQVDPVTSLPVAMLADAPSGLAVERRVGMPGRLLFVAHEYRNEIRVFDAVTGARVGTISSPGPRALAVAMWGQSYQYSALWVIERNVSAAPGVGPSHVVRK